MNETRAPGSRTAALVGVVTGNVLIHLVALVSATAGIEMGEIAGWYTGGGIAMHPLMLLAMVQFAALIVLGVLGLHRALPVCLAFVVPALVVAVGVGGALLGGAEAVEALMTATVELRATMLSMSLAFADLPLQFALGLASLGCLGAVVNLGAAAYARREAGWVRPALVVGVAGVVLVPAALAAVVAVGPAELGVAVAVGFVLLGLVAVAGLALVGAELAALVRVADGRALSLALGAALAAVGWAVAWGLALHSGAVQSACRALATAPAELVAAGMAAAGERATSAQLLLQGGAGALALVAALAVSRAWASWRAWGVRQVVDLALIAALLAGATVLVGQVGAHRRASVERIFTFRQHALPVDLALPRGDGPVVLEVRMDMLAVHRDELWSWGESLGKVNDAQTTARLADVAVRREDLGTDAGSDLPAALLEPVGCPVTPRWPTGLALEGAARFEALRPVLRWLAGQGFCGLQVVLAPADAEAQSLRPSYWRHLGVAAQLRDAQLNRPRALEVQLAVGAAPPEGEAIVVQPTDGATVQRLVEASLAAQGAADATGAPRPIVWWLGPAAEAP